MGFIEIIDISDGSDSLVLPILKDLICVLEAVLLRSHNGSFACFQDNIVGKSVLSGPFGDIGDFLIGRSIARLTELSHYLIDLSVIPSGCVFSLPGSGYAALFPGYGNLFDISEIGLVFRSTVLEEVIEKFVRETKFFTDINDGADIRG